MTNDTPPGAGSDPSPGNQPRAYPQREETLNFAKAEYTRRLQFLAQYTDMYIGFPERKPPHLTLNQLRDEWRREGLIMNALVKNAVRAGNALLEAIEQTVSIE